MARFFLSHVTDSVFGRQGFTLDWPKTLNGTIPEDWGGFTGSPPLDWTWRQHLPDQPHIVARNAVKPFALYSEGVCNLLLIAEPLAASVTDWDDTLVHVRTGTIAFGKRVHPYRVAALRHAKLCRDPVDYSPDNIFDLYETSGYHIHGTRVQRGERTAADCPTPLRTDLRFSDYQEYRTFRRQSSGNRLVPTRLRIKTFRLPLAFSTGLDLYLCEDLANRVADQKTPGLSFPYAPISVTAENG